jgi:peptide deformylase
MFKQLKEKFKMSFAFNHNFNISREELAEAEQRYVEKHRVISKQVTEDDLPRVINDGKLMVRLCNRPAGIYPGAKAIAHSQINDTDPLAFFVTAHGAIVINPKITRHVNYTKECYEGCMTHYNEPNILVPRWPKIEVDFQTLLVVGENFVLSEVRHETLTGEEAFIFQHEIDHMFGKYISDFIK